jgi:hypothetical protein
MPVPLVVARPDRLQRFRVTAAALADGLERRVGATRAALAAYEARTEPAFEVPCRGSVDAVDRLGGALAALGGWVGRVGDAFEHLPTHDGIAFDLDDQLLAAVPATPAVGAGAPGNGATLADAVEDVALGALASLRSGTTAAAAGAAAAGGAGGVASRAASRAAGSPITTASQVLAVIAAGRVGMGEIAHRWQTEEGSATWARAGRAGLDGVLNGAGMLAGGAAGAALGEVLCGAAPPAAAACVTAAGTFGGELGRRGGELLGDVLLGDEPAVWERDPLVLSLEIADVDGAALDAAAADLDAAAAESADLAGRHRGFVLEHPWVWADTYHDAPVVPPPPPAAAIPTDGPR